MPTRLVVLVLAAIATPSFAQFSTLVQFGYGNGLTPNPLTLGADGNFYGTTQYGGASELGTFFKMTPSGTLTTIYSFPFTPFLAGGADPNTPLVQAADGTFYGAACCGGNVFWGGTIFRITPAGAYTKLYSVGATYQSPGTPTAGLTLTGDGNFYGTTVNGGTSARGTVFKMTPEGTVTILHNFNGADGQGPNAKLIQASDGNLYGTAGVSTPAYPGQTNFAAFFRISASGTFNVVYAFPLSNAPTSNLTLASDGNFYGTTTGGDFFKIDLGGTLTSVATHTLLAGTGAVALIQGRDGNFYGTSTTGGDTGRGMIFRITPQGTVATLYSFCEQTDCPDSWYPTSLLQAPDGSLVGTTDPPGADVIGSIFRLQLPSATCNATAPPEISSVESASAYGGYSYFASGSWLEIKGTNLADPSDPRLTAATNPGQWTASDFSGANAPLSLDGNSVSIGGLPAYVSYISTSQLNVQAPENPGPGAISVTATNCIGTSAPYTFVKQTLAPGLLAPANYSANGTQYLVATFASDGAYVLSAALGASFGLATRPATPGQLIVAYGVGFGDVRPAIPPGVIVSQSNTLVNPVTFQFGSASATVSYAGLAAGYIGLYEFFITVPVGLADGDYPVIVMQNGNNLPQAAYLSIQN